MPSSNQPSRFALIRSIYLYLVSLIALMMIVFSLADLANIALRTWVFPKADLNQYAQPSCAAMIAIDPTGKEATSSFQQRLDACDTTRISDDEMRAIQKQKDIVRDLSLSVVGFPLLAAHWLIIRKERKKSSEA